MPEAAPHGWNCAEGRDVVCKLVERAGGAGMDAELVLEAGEAHDIAFEPDDAESDIDGPQRLAVAVHGQGS